MGTLDTTRSIARKIIREGHKAGYVFRLLDEEGEELTPIKAGEQRLLADIGATGMEMLQVWRQEGSGRLRRVGTFILIAENGEDNPSDYSWRVSPKPDDETTPMERENIMHGLNRAGED